MFNWIRNLFKKKPQKVEVKILWNIEDKRIKEKEYKKENKQKELKKQYNSIKETPMDYNNIKNYWLIVVDTKGIASSKQARDENDNSPINEINVKALGQLGLKTFSLVNAPDVITAKGIFWKTLMATNPQSRPYIQIISAATRVTNLTQILPVIAKPGSVWNYIPGPRESLPGQQPISRDNLLAKDKYGSESAVEYSHIPPSVPEDYVTQVDKKDIGSLTEADRKIMSSNNNSQMDMTSMSNLVNDPKLMMEMMAKMLQTLTANQQTNQRKKEEPTFERLSSIHDLNQEELNAINQKDPREIVQEEEDQELQEQILNFRENKENVNIEIQSDDISSDEIKQMAKATSSQVLSAGSPSL